MEKSFVVSLLLAGTLGAVASAHAVDARTRFMAANCGYCHGTDGKSRGAIPSLAGLDKAYFVQQMKDFRSGARSGDASTVMHQHATGYTDEEFEKLGEWFSKIK